MKPAAYALIGRVIDDGTGKGVHGLEVKALAQPRWRRCGSVFGMARRRVVVGTVLTRQDGGFTIGWRGSWASRLLTRRTAVWIEIFDRDGKRIFAADAPTAVRRGSLSLPAMRLPADRLADHLSRPATLTSSGGRLLSRSVFEQIGRAIELLSPRGTQDYTDLLGSAYCPLPSIDGFEDLLDDAWGVIRQDLDARQRFRDMLDVAAGPAARPQMPTSVRRTDPVAKRAGELSAVEALLGREAFVPVVLAGAVVAAGKPHERERYVELVLDQLSAYRPIATLYESATTALSGGPGERARFQAVMLGMRDWCAGDVPSPPDMPEIPGPPISDLPALEESGCTADLDAALDSLRDRLESPTSPPGAAYTIDSITPERACAGATITIRGSGFTNAHDTGPGTPVLVRFAGPGTGEIRSTYIDVEPSTWTDTEITVVAPEDAHCGPLSLRIPEEVVTVMVCDAFVDVSTYRAAASTTIFSGCRPMIRRFDVNGGQRCVPRDMPARLDWAVHPPDANVTIREERDGVARDLYSGGGPAGAVMLDTTVVGPRGLSIAAGNPHADCEEITLSFPDEAGVPFTIGPPAPVLTIAGVELTQGIQRYSLADPESPENNSVELVAGMDTIVRVFVRCERGGFEGDMARISGFVTMSQGARVELYRPINGLPAGSAPFVDAKPNPSRDRTNDSLNFLIPAAHAHGDGRLDIQIMSAERCEDYVSVGTAQAIGWTERPAYPVTIRRIADPGGAVMTAAQALALVNAAFRLLPSPRTEIRLHPGVFSIGEATRESDYCRDWSAAYQLAQSLAYEHNGVEGLAPDPHESAWIGLVFQRCGRGMMSWPISTDTCFSARDAPPGARDAANAAHELAHTTGMGHARTGAGESCDDLFAPVACHDLPNRGRLTDAPFLIDSNRVVLGARDLMSYQTVRFPHPNHWEMIRERMNSRF